ncbi:NERD domain-containing protein [Clostridium sp.]|uniref:NERD domain-containing protein n=1 Tax=Clostridium sp. TaxID=1506 RepID=UPI002FC931DF
MSFLEFLFGEVKTINKPMFVKDFSKENNQLSDLEELYVKIANNEKKELIERDIMFLKQGIAGENNVYYELKNSFMPMLCLHDIRIEHEDYVAQLDFVVITNKFMAILETKKLNGDITINRDGDFIRTIRAKGGRAYKEGIYSPVSQNKRHVNIMKDLLSKKLNVNNLPIISLVVIANTKSIIDKDKCPNDIKYSIYKYDQIGKQLEKHKNNKKNEYNLSEKYMNQIADLLVEMNAPISFNNIAKYGITEEDFIKDVKESASEEIKNIAVDIENPSNMYKLPSDEKVEVIKEVAVEEISEEPVESKNEVKKTKEELIESLKKYRLETCKKENVAAYFIFNNAEMEDLIEKYPRTKEELLKVRGFGAIKVEKYGKEILEILNE